MLEQFIFSFTVVVPIFVLLAIGVLIRRSGLVNEDGFRQLNKLVFNILLPSNVFYSIATADRGQFELKLGLLVLLGILAIFGLAMVIVPKLVKKPTQRGVIVQSLIRGNFVILGFPILTRIYGTQGLSMVGLILLISMPLYNITSVIALESQANKLSLGSMFRKIMTNPLIIATILGFGAIFIPLGDIIGAPIGMLAEASGTIALITLGGLLNVTNLRSNRRMLLSVSLTRLILIPLCLLAIAYTMNFTEQALMTLMVFFGAPVAVVSFAMVERLGGDETLAGQLILVTTGLSLFSYVWWIGLIRSLFVG